MVVSQNLIAYKLTRIVQNGLAALLACTMASHESETVLKVQSVGSPARSEGKTNDSPLRE